MMIRRLFVLALVMTMASVANAAVVFDWTGGGGTTAWDTPTNWTVTGATTWAAPSEQYSGVASANVNDAPADGPNYAYINSDITNINISGAVVDKTAELPPVTPTPGTSAYTVFGGDNCVLTLDNAATLTLGRDLWLGEDIEGAGGVTSTINVYNGSTLNLYNWWLGHGGNAVVNVTGGSTFNVPARWGRMGYYEGGSATLYIEDSTFYNHQSLHLGDVTNTTATFTLINSTATNGTRLRVGNGDGSNGTLTMDHSTLSVGDYLGVGRGTGGVGTMTMTNGSTVTTASYVTVGYANATGTLNLTDSTLTIGDGGDDDMTVGDPNGTGTVNLTRGTLSISDDMNIGFNGATGTVNLTDNSSLTVPDELFMGGDQYNAGTGTLNLDHSTVTVGDVLRVGRAECVDPGSGKVPGTGGTGTINVGNGSTFNSVNQMRIGYGGDGTMNVTGGSTVHHDGDCRITYIDGSRGWLNVTDSTFNVDNYIAVGYAAGTTAYATFNNAIVNGGVVDNVDLNFGQGGATCVANVTNGSVVTAGNDMYIGGGANGNATLNIDDSSVTIKTGHIYVTNGNGGQAVVNLTNGATFGTESSELRISRGNVDSRGTINASGGSTIYCADRMYIGHTGGVGTVNLTDSTINCGTDFRLGYEADATGYLNIYGNSVVNIGRDFETSANGGQTKGSDPGLASYIHMYDGDMNIDGYCSLGTQGQGGSYTEFILDAGTVDIGLDPPIYNTEDFDPVQEGNKLSDLILGWYDYDAEAYLTINGGEMTVHGRITFGSEVHWTTEDPLNPGTYLPDPHTGSGTGTLRITINGGVLQGEDLIYTGHTPDSLLVLTGGELRINGSAVSEADMLALILGDDISCPNGYQIFTDGDYTVLTVPEPTTMVMVLMGFVGLGLICRRNKD